MGLSCLFKPYSITKMLIVISSKGIVFKTASSAPSMSRTNISITGLPKNQELYWLGFWVVSPFLIVYLTYQLLGQWNKMEM